MPGAVLLLAGEPGVGKSTLLLEVAARWARRAATLYVSGEESVSQVRLRAERTGALDDNLYLAAETDLSAILAHVEAVAARPARRRLDPDPRSPTSTAPPAASPRCATLPRRYPRAKARNLATLLVGHVTKDGSVAGPRALEHLVDVVLQFEGDRNSRLRMLRAVKNRFGPVDEIGCFDLGDDGIVEVADPSGLFVSRHEEPAPAPASPSRSRAGGRCWQRCRRSASPTRPRARRARRPAGWSRRGWRC